MSRSGYSEDLENWDLIRWRGRVASSIRGARGQAMLKELLKALDAMPEKRLVRAELVTEQGDCCAIGALLLHREVPDPKRYEDWNEELADELDVAECLVREIEYENDEGRYSETPEHRWERMRRWIESRVKMPAETPEEAAALESLEESDGE